MDRARQLITQGPLFVVAYVVLMLPTYVLPYYGSNSTLLRAVAGPLARNWPFWAHLAFLSLLMVLAWERGTRSGKSWLVVFPFLALVFDLVPVLTVIPLIPTTMHLLAMIVGAMATKTAGVVDIGGLR